MKNIHKNIGESLDDFLREEGILDEVDATAWKRVIAFQIEQEMKAQNLTKTELAKRVRTSRASLNRLLDPDNTSITLNRLNSVVSALGKKISIELV
jgi:DNA-binding Xre family transcriptional regulator